jgi:hypothetical protein
MKKIIAILLLIATLFTALHARVTFHYCSGTLHSVMPAAWEEPSCCDDDDHRQPGENELDTKVVLQNTPCCRNLYREISTDDFPIHRPVVTVESRKDFHLPLLFIPAPGWGWGNVLATQTFQAVFPPGSGAKSGFELLVFICIFRI